MPRPNLQSKGFESNSEVVLDSREAATLKTIGSWIYITIFLSLRETARLILAINREVSFFEGERTINMSVRQFYFLDEEMESAISREDRIHGKQRR